MKIDSILKKEGIEVISCLDVLQINIIANSISNKLVTAFGEHNLKKENLFNSISNINMYICDLPKDSAGAKYFYKTNTIYFDRSLSTEQMADLAVHECIHFIQELRDNKNNIIRLGLYDFNSALGLNEASVQYMTAIANKNKKSREKYYNIDLKTISPDYYPLECTLINEIIYFTGTYPLFHSTLYSDDMFKNTFVSKSNKQTYEQFVYNLDILLNLETELDGILRKCTSTNSISLLKSLNSKATKYKSEINFLFFETQNLIMENFFTKELNSIDSLDAIKNLKNKLYNYKNVIGSSDTYTFYNDFYCKILTSLEEKREIINNFYNTNIYGEKTSEVLSLALYSKKMSLVQSFIKRILKLFHKNDEETNF